MRNLAAFSLQRKDYAGALTHFKALAAAYPDDAEIVVSLAELYHANKQPAEAVTTLQKAIQAKKATNEAVPETWRSEEHTSELQSLMRISYAVFCLHKKNIVNTMYTVSRYKSPLTSSY